MYCEWVMKIFGMWVGRRTESDWTADGIRLGGGRNPIGRRTGHDDKSCGFGQRKLRGCIIYIIMCRSNWWGKGLDFVSKNLHTMRLLCRKRKYFALKMQFFAHFYW